MFFEVARSPSGAHRGDSARRLERSVSLERNPGRGGTHGPEAAQDGEDRQIVSWDHRRRISN